ncbi:unnamed protein product, partial [Rotaria magnacalcarata]
MRVKNACPPAYYGDRCQYQNQHVPLILRFRDENSHKFMIINIIIT